jgi:hypothetical protein
VVLAYALFSRRLEGSIVTGPLFFVAAGTVAGPDALDLVSVDVTRSTAFHVAELALFSDAARVDLRALLGNTSLPGRLLGIGMPHAGRRRTRSTVASLRPDERRGLRHPRMRTIKMTRTIMFTSQLFAYIQSRTFGIAVFARLPNRGRQDRQRRDQQRQSQNGSALISDFPLC